VGGVFAALFAVVARREHLNTIVQLVAHEHVSTRVPRYPEGNAGSVVIACARATRSVRGCLARAFLRRRRGTLRGRHSALPGPIRGIGVSPVG
jgi:hypothetical protein